MTDASKKIFTIGHSSHEIVRFVGLLHLHHIDAVADVRSMPYSRRQPQFNKNNLGTVLKEHGIAYVFLGKELGGEATIRNAMKMDVSNIRNWPKQKNFDQGYSE